MSDHVERLDAACGYSKIAKIFHWGFVALFAYGVLKQVDDIGQLRDTALLRFAILFASTLLIMLGARFLYMRRTKQTSLPEETPYAQKIAAKIDETAFGRHKFEAGKKLNNPTFPKYFY